MQFPDKVAAAQRPYSIAILGMPEGVVVNSATVDISVISGDDNTPQGMKVGPAVVNTDVALLKNGRFRLPAGSVVSQRLQGGVAGVLYRVRYTLTLSNTDVLVHDVDLLVI